MKKYLYTLCLLCFCTGFLSAQDTISVTENQVYKTVNVGDTSDDDIAGYVDITNNANETRTFTWERTIVSKPDGWNIAFCDLNLCYAPHVSTESYMQDAGSTNELTLHAYPGGSPGATITDADAGTAEVHVRIYEDGNETNDETIVFYITLDATSGITELERASLRLYPNPTQHFFKISENDLVASVKVMDILGQTKMVETVGSNSTVSVSNLQRGMYLVQMMDDKGDLVKTVRLMKD